jgi:hypothetical protein
LEREIPAWIVGFVGIVYPQIVSMLLLRSVFFQSARSEQQGFLALIVELVSRECHEDVAQAVAAVIESNDVPADVTIDDVVRAWTTLLPFPSLFTSCASSVIELCKRLADQTQHQAGTTQDDATTRTVLEAIVLEEEQEQKGDGTAAGGDTNKLLASNTDASCIDALLANLALLSSALGEFLHFLESVPEATPNTTLLQTIKQQLHTNVCLVLIDTHTQLVLPFRCLNGEHQI